MAEVSTETQPSSSSPELAGQIQIARDLIIDYSKAYRLSATDIRFDYDLEPSATQQRISREEYVGQKLVVSHKRAHILKHLAIEALSNVVKSAADTQHLHMTTNSTIFVGDFEPDGTFAIPASLVDGNGMLHRSFFPLDAISRFHGNRGFHVAVGSEESGFFGLVALGKMLNSGLVKIEPLVRVSIDDEDSAQSGAPARGIKLLGILQYDHPYRLSKIKR